MNSKLFKSIIALEQAKEMEIEKINESYEKRLKDIREKCNHVDDDGINVLVPALKPFHDGWYHCPICGRYIEPCKKQIMDKIMH